MDTLYQDNDLLVINKPPLVHSVPIKNNLTNTVPEILLREFPDFELLKEHDYGVCHRLDYETSGALIVAKNLKTYTAIRRLFKEEKIQKIYKAIVSGKFEGPMEINKPLKNHPRSKRVVIVNSKGRDAYTNILDVEYFFNFSLLTISISSGHRHQIRVHLKFLGYPIVGDTIYSKSQEEYERHFLHAYQLSFIHPSTNKRLTITSDLPKDFQNLLKK